jgi:hypothetical protein
MEDNHAWWVGKDTEWGSHDLFQITIPGFALRERGKPQATVVSEGGDPATIRTWRPTSAERYRRTKEYFEMRMTKRTFIPSRFDPW